MQAKGVVLFATGSPLLADFEESLGRAGIPVVAGVRNHPGTSWLSLETPCLHPKHLAPDVRLLPFLVPLFTPANRRLAARQALALEMTHPFTLIDPSVPVPRRLTLGEGSYINAGCTLGSASEFGSFVLINRGSSIGHHVRLGDFVSAGPGAVIAGEATVGTGTLIGAGATVLPGVTIGENAVIGAGAVVTCDVPAGCLVTGNPARAVRRGVGGDRGRAVA